MEKKKYINPRIGIHNARIKGTILNNGSWYQGDTGGIIPSGNQSDFNVRGRDEYEW